MIILNPKLFKSNHWSEMLTQICDDPTAKSLKAITYKEWWDKSLGDTLLLFLSQEGSISTITLKQIFNQIIIEVVNKYPKINMKYINLLKKSVANSVDVCFMDEIPYLIWYNANININFFDFNKLTADIIRQLIPMPTQLYDQFIKLQQFKAFW